MDGAGLADALLPPGGLFRSTWQCTDDLEHLPKFLDAYLGKVAANLAQDDRNGVTYEVARHLPPKE